MSFYTNLYHLLVKIFSISDDAQNFKKKHGLVDWICIKLPLVRKKSL